MRNILICDQRSSILPVSLFFCLFFLSCTSIKHTCTSIFFLCKCSVTPTLNACLSHVSSNTCAFTIMSFHWLCVCCVKQHACLTFQRSISDQAAFCYSLHFFPSSYVKVKTLYRSPNPRSPRNRLLPPTLLVSSYLASWQGLRWSWSPPPPSSLTSLPL